MNVSDKAGYFTDTDLKVFEIIAKQSAISIHKARMVTDLEYLSQTDPMTGLLNYRCFTQKLEEELGRASRYEQSFSLMMVDTDYFKRYNDTHGHLAGDKLLQDLAQIFKEALRTTDIVCRYGGDEFVVILPNTDGAQACIAGEKLRERVEARFHQDKISLSIGVAEFQPGFNKEMFVQRADQTLYEAKNTGKNKVVLARETL